MASLAKRINQGFVIDGSKVECFFGKMHSKELFEYVWDWLNRNFACVHLNLTLLSKHYRCAGIRNGDCGTMTWN